MSAWFPSGRAKFINATAGHDDDIKRVAGLLTLGTIYDVVDENIGSSYSYVKLKGFVPWFNTVQFADAPQRRQRKHVPAQTPGSSEQEYETPRHFLVAVSRLLKIAAFDIDLAADDAGKKAKADAWYGPTDNALVQDWKHGTGWAWLNPPYEDIEPWVERAKLQAQFHDANIAMLIPASVGSNYWRAHVHNKCAVLLLNGRIKFVGHTSGYPKDLALLLYTPQPPGDLRRLDWTDHSYYVWRWTEEKARPE